jgi:hypothetical protein
MRLFIRKYEIRKLILEEHNFHDRDITLLYYRKNRENLTNFRYQDSIYAFKLINSTFHFNLIVFEFWPDLLLQICLFTLQTYTFYNISYSLVLNC